MSAAGHWRSLFNSVYRASTSGTTTKRIVGGVCASCGTAIAMYALWNQKQSFSQNMLSAVSPKLTYAASHEPSKMSKATATDRTQFIRGKRFLDFASVEVNGEVFMTPQDFLESVTEEYPRPRIGRLQLSNQEVEAMLRKTPDRKKCSSRFFRSLHNKGLISYTEYLFFLCILTKPKAGFHIAFNMFDADGNQRVDKKEFLVLGEIFRKRTETTIGPKTKSKPNRLGLEMSSDDRIMAIKESSYDMQDTSLLIHLFGRNGKNVILYQDFYRFMDNLQTEVLEMEFLAYSHGMATISEEDFARMLLKYTDIADTEEYIAILRKRIPEEKGITFEEFRSFFQFLNNLEDFAIAMQMYTLAGRSIGQDEFKRAVKISTGHELSEHLVNTLFQLFDKDGDNRLSQVEFIGIMKDRIHRGFKRHGNLREFVGFEGYSRCVSRELHLYVRDLAAQSRPNNFFL